MIRKMFRSKLLYSTENKKFILMAHIGTHNLFVVIIYRFYVTSGEKMFENTIFVYKKIFQLIFEVFRTIFFSLLVSGLFGAVEIRFRVVT